MEGWKKVGAALGQLFNPTPVEETDAYRQRVSENLTLDQKMATAGRSRIETMALQSIMDDPNLDPLQKNLLAAKLGTQFAGVEQGLLRQQERGFRDETFARADAADYGVNAPLMALARGPVAVNKALAGGKLQGNEFLPGSGFETTNLGEAELGRLFAQAGASNARAQADLSRAANYDARTAEPERFRAPPRAGSSNPSVYSPKEVLEIVEYNRMANSTRGQQAGLKPIQNVPRPGDPKPTGAVVPAPAATTTEGPVSVGMPEGARQAPDGNWYVQQGGRWFRVEQ